MVDKTVRSGTVCGHRLVWYFLVFRRRHGCPCWNYADLAGNNPGRCVEAKPDWLPTACSSQPKRWDCLFASERVDAVAGIGWFRRRPWGWGLAVAIIAVQVLGDLVNFLRGDSIRGGIGAIIAGTLLLYLFSGNVRKNVCWQPDWAVSYLHPPTHLTLSACRVAR